MENTINILAFCILGLFLLFCLLYIFGRSVYKKIDTAFDKVIGVLLGNITIGIGVAIVVAGLFIFGIQVYTWLSQGTWSDISLLGTAKAGIGEHISALISWVNQKLQIEASISYILAKTPLSVFLLLVGLLVAFLGLTIEGGKGDEASLHKKEQE